MNRTLSLYIAMILAGIAGYLILWLSVRTLSSLDYALFASFWSALYFLVGSLAGVQQEVTRASRPHASMTRSPLLENASTRLAVMLVLLVVLTGIAISVLVSLLSPESSGVDFSQAIAPLTLGVASYVVVAVISGSLYGLKNWTLLAWMILGDALLRLGLVSWIVLTHQHVELLFWAISVPFGLILFVLSPWLVSTLRNKVSTDVGLGKLSTHSAQAVLAALGMSLIVSGFPGLLTLSSGDTSVDALSQSMFIVTLARALFVVVAISLQSLLLVRFKDVTSPVRLVSKLTLAGLVLAVLLIPLGLLWSQGIFEFVVGSPAVLSPLFLTSTFLSGIFLALLVVTGVATLAKSHHGLYVAGWATAAVLTVFALFLPMEFEARVMVSLLVAPLVGVAIHIVGLKLISRGSETT